ncbi:MAG: 2-oxoacid:acceptor oxidoreductase family protein [Clostridiales bacterium]|nr:2-oxoacid:acceptor oxidoreductase family protein [Clostridiales bacterium]
MKTNHQILIAGFGGQGILFAGKFLVYAGLLQNYEVSWLPSYGPEMRGGTANCNVMISDEPVGSPIVINPTELIVMNSPSFDKFESSVIPGGKLFVDSTLISTKSERTDISTFYIPATKIASDNNIPKLANIIMIGKFIKETGICTDDIITKTIEKNVPSNKPELLALNKKALELGLNFEN